MSDKSMSDKSMSDKSMSDKSILLYDGYYHYQEKYPISMNQSEGAALIEHAGRVCYDSFGRGRSSEEFHRHIAEVGHYSIYEHFNMTVEVDHGNLAEALVGRPGVWLFDRRITYNPRVVVDWEKIRNRDIWLKNKLAAAMRCILPEVMKWHDLRYDVRGWRFVVPEMEEERWYTFHLFGSRGFSHELVRHGDFTAISQRSTRYCNEALTPWILHPSLREKLDVNLASRIEAHIDRARTIYKDIVNLFNNRKEGHGAARGILGNALQTQVVFSASLRQWKRIIDMRCSPAADAEIREVISQVKDYFQSEGGNDD